MMISIGSNAFMIRGMPGGRHIQDGSQPCPPAFWSAVFHSKIFWYSGVSGALSPAWTQRGGPTRSHLPFRSGYLLSSNAAAPAAVMSSAASVASEAIVRRYCMAYLPALLLRLVEIAQVGRLLTFLGRHQIAVGAH